MTIPDDYTHRTTKIREGKRHLDAVIANGLFSRGGLDSGTSALLGSLRNHQPKADADGAPKTILDLGCGWGGISLALAARYPDAQILATDRDLLAVKTTAHNAALNDLGNISTSLALGYEVVSDAQAWPETFDWIVTNVPAKAGINGIQQLLFGAGERMAEGGLLAVVFVNPIGDMIVELVEELGKAITVEVEWQQARSEHTIFHLRFPEGLPPLFAPDVPLMPGMKLPAESPLWPYLREDVMHAPDDMPALAVNNVAEFDTPDLRNNMVTKVVQSTVPKPDGASNGTGERILIFNPRHGWLARDLIRERSPAEVVMVDRDALALAAASANVRRVIGNANTPVFRAVAGLALGATDVAGGEPVTGPFDIIVGVMNPDEGRNGLRRLLREAAILLKPNGVLVFGLAAAEVASQLKHAAQNLHFRFGRLLKRRSFAAQVLRPPKSGSRP